MVDLPYAPNSKDIANYFDMTRLEDIAAPRFGSADCDPEISTICCLPGKTSTHMPWWIGFREDFEIFVKSEPASDSATLRLYTLIEKEKQYKICDHYIRLMSSHAWYGISQILHLHHIYPDREGPPQRKKH